MSNEDTETTYQYFSTLRHPSFTLEKMLGSEVGEDGEVWIDPFNPNIMEMLSLPRTVRINYDGSTPVTTISKRIYGNTSLWFLIVACSDYLHPHQIPKGHIIMVPSGDAVVSYLKDTTENKGNQGKVIKI